jgi:hypothetical protein
MVMAASMISPGLASLRLVRFADDFGAGDVSLIGVILGPWAEGYVPSGVKECQPVISCID